MILTLTDQFDMHADVVLQKLASLGHKVYRLNLDTESLMQTEFTYSNQQWTVRSNEGKIVSDQVSCVWLRRPFVELTLQEQNIAQIDFKIWHREWNKTLLGFYTSVRNLPWLNPLQKAYRAENKYLQMEIAREIGLKMPPTLISNNKDRLLEFAKDHGFVAMKLMTQEFYQDSEGSFKGIYVNKLEAGDLEDFGGFSENPIVLQSYIPKSFEVRYTVVGNDHHVCRIDSQMSNIANVDWRKYDIPNTPHTAIEAPREIYDKVVKLMKTLDIEFGGLDFIVSLDQEWYFLEVNSMGQWLWIEDLTGLRISDSIVDWLTTQKRRAL